MKLKDILNKKKPIIKEDVSTMKIKSNIAQTWKDERNVEEDLVAWFDGAVSAGSADLGDDILVAMEAALQRMRKINDAFKI